MDLSTTYLGLKLRNSAGAVGSRAAHGGHRQHQTDGRFRRGGGGAIFACSRSNCAWSAANWIIISTQGTESFPEALTYFPEPVEFNVGPEQYLKHIAKAKARGENPHHRQPERLARPAAGPITPKKSSRPAPTRWS